MSNKDPVCEMYRNSALAATLSVGLLGIVYWYRRPLPAWHESAEKKSLLRTFLPEAEFTGEVSTTIHASPEAVFAALHSVTLEDMPIAKWLGELRYLPKRLFGAPNEAPSAPKAIPFLQLLQGEGGNILLAYEPNKEIVFGAIGQFHNLTDQRFVALRSPADFIEFDHPDYQKLAMSFRLTTLVDGSSQRLKLTHGTHALSDESRRCFALYWLLIKPGGNLVSWLLLRAVKTIAERQQQRVTS
jgi:hypothetical protein